MKINIKKHITDENESGAINIYNGIDESILIFKSDYINITHCSDTQETALEAFFDEIYNINSESDLILDYKKKRLSLV